MMDINNTSNSDQMPKRSDYPGLTEYMAASFAAVAALSDEELKAYNKALYEKDHMADSFVYLRDNSPEEAAKELGVSVEDMKKMSPEEMVTQAKRHTEQMPMEELRAEIFESQQRFAATRQEKEAGENEAGSSAG